MNLVATDERQTAMVLSDMVRALVRAVPQLPALAPLRTRTPTLSAHVLRRRTAPWACYVALQARQAREHAAPRHARSDTLLPSARRCVPPAADQLLEERAAERHAVLTQPGHPIQRCAAAAASDRPQAAPRLAHSMHAASHRQASPPTF